jgi:putative endonuclease
MSLEVGGWGEELAKEHLLKSGYEILETNYRFKKSEIDLIAKKGNLIIAVEVKTRTGIIVGTPFHAITREKQRNLLLGINHYVQKFNEPVEVRMDAVSIIKQGETITIAHLEDAFPAF